MFVMTNMCFLQQTFCRDKNDACGSSHQWCISVRRFTAWRYRTWLGCLELVHQTTGHEKSGIFFPGCGREWSWEERYLFPRLWQRVVMRRAVSLPRLWQRVVMRRAVSLSRLWQRVVMRRAVSSPRLWQRVVMRRAVSLPRLWQRVVMRRAVSLPRLWQRVVMKRALFLPRLWVWSWEEWHFHPSIAQCGHDKSGILTQASAEGLVHWWSTENCWCLFNFQLRQGDGMVWVPSQTLGLSHQCPSHLCVYNVLFAVCCILFILSFVLYYCLLILLSALFSPLFTDALWSGLIEPENEFPFYQIMDSKIPVLHWFVLSPL